MEQAPWLINPFCKELGMTPATKQLLKDQQHREQVKKLAKQGKKGL
jgi:hypothetical protein